MEDFFIFHLHLGSQGQPGWVVRAFGHAAIQQYQFQGVNLTLQPDPNNVGR